MTTTTALGDNMPQITVLITDDHTLVRETWSIMFKRDSRFKVVAECGSGEAAVELSKELRPDIIIMDINLPDMNGIEATQLIRRFSPDTKVLGVSLHRQPSYAQKMIRQGAMGYVTKSSGREEMIKAIFELKNGRKYICEETKTIISNQLINGEDPSCGFNALSERELQITEHIQKGASSKEIAEALFISVKTVEVHRYNILKKLHLKNSAALVNYMNQHYQG